MKVKLWAIILWGLLSLDVVAPARAQTSDTGALTGTVKDPSGGVIPGVVVTLVNNATARTLTAVTSTAGVYRFPLLPPGAYSVKFFSEGFKTAEIRAVTINVTESPARDDVLEVGTAEEQVMVTGEALATELRVA